MSGDNSADASIPHDVKQAAKHIHSTPTVCVLNVTGGGSLAIPWLLATPGASATVLSASVPYSVNALRSLLREAPRGACSPATAAAMAAASYRAAVAQSPAGTPVVGIGATCALRTTRELRGAHRAHICARTDHAEIRYHLQFDKFAERSRLQEDCLASRLVIQALLDSCSPPLAHVTTQPMSLVRTKLTSPHDVLSNPEVFELQDAVDALYATCVDSPETTMATSLGSATLSELRARPRFAQMDPVGIWRLGAVSTSALLPGSFNPLHHGHQRLLDAARSFLAPEASVGYELSMSNADKPPLAASEVRSRADQFLVNNLRGAALHAPLVVTTEPLFAGKAKLLPDTTFIVGYDTAVRIVNPKYYGGQANMIEALVEIASSECRFLVAGRRESPTSGNFLTLRSVSIPSGFETLFQEIPESMFREDVSSTQIRNAAQNHDAS